MPPYVRRQPLIERLKSSLNIYDFLLWLSEEIESNGWDQVEKEWAVPVGLGFNLVFMIARANVGRRSKGYNDVFGEDRGPSYVAGMAWFLTHFLALISVLNAFYTFFRKRHYRLFESSVDARPSTPSARRVAVQSSATSSSPLKYLSALLGTESANARAHPDAQRDVWEIAVWDPLPLSLRLFCYFNPGHVIIYWTFLPTLAADSRPSITVATAILLACLLSLQLSLFTHYFTQQGRDMNIISKEVWHEYDTKFVRPRTQPLYRDVGTQYTEQASYSDQREEKYNTVDTYTPMFVINRGFRPSPNPNYSAHTESGNDAPRTKPLRPQTSTPNFRSPTKTTDFSSPIKPPTALRQPNFRPTAGAGVGDGGSLGVYSHAASPLRKSASTNFSLPSVPSQPDRSSNRDALSPEKHLRDRRSTPSTAVNSATGVQNWSHYKADPRRRETGRF